MEALAKLSPPVRGTPLTLVRALKLAISEAYRGAARVSPNPLVGCVILDSKGQFLSSGYHEYYGGPHAEVNAVKGLRPEELKNAHVIVTLEPCAHEGKTPSCAQMLATLPIRKVTYGLEDPNPLVSGQGAEILRQAGIEASVFSSDDLQEDQSLRVQLEEVCEAFLWNFRYQKTFVALKMASSLDGQVALKNGESQWITGPESREFVHFLRASYDAILVGKGTIEFDNPSLNIRHALIKKENKVVVIDGEADLLGRYTTLNLADMHAGENVYWCIAEEVRSEALAKIKDLEFPPHLIFVPTAVSGELDLENLLSQLYTQGLRSVMVEGGAMTASTFVAHKLVNRIYLFQAPHLMGAGGARSWTENLRIEKMADKIRLKNPRYEIFGEDFMVTGRLS